MTLTSTAAHLETAYFTAKRGHKQRKVIARKRVLITARILVKENQRCGFSYRRRMLNALRGAS